MTITASGMGGSHNYGPKTPEAIAKREESARQAEEAKKVDLSELDKGFTLLQYQLAAHNTAIYPEVGTGSLTALTYLFLKLNGEAGEAAEKFAKIIRDKGGRGTPEDREEILKEIGDVLWYVAMLADELDASLEDVAQANVAKLKSRKERGVLGGSGDNR